MSIFLVFARPGWSQTRWCNMTQLGLMRRHSTNPLKNRRHIRSHMRSLAPTRPRDDRRIRSQCILRPRFCEIEIAELRLAGFRQ